MDKKSKVISGLREIKKIKSAPIYFTESEKHSIIQEYLKTGCAKIFIWEKYTGRKDGDHGTLLDWMRRLGYIDDIGTRRVNFASNPSEMNKRNQSKEFTELPDSFESLQLKKRIEELEKELRETKMKVIAFSTMVDIAEKEFNIRIRKKYNTKPLNR